MKSDRHARIKTVFLEACDLPPEQRQAFLTRACVGDDDLRQAVDRLLAHHVPLASGAEPHSANKPSPSRDVAIADTSDILDLPRYATGHLIAERYRIVSLMGEGAMGRVYRAEDLSLNLTVALKFLPRLHGLDPTWKRRVAREVKLARAVSHPNVCRVYDLTEVDGIPVISMEFVDGEDLGALLRRIGRLTGDRAVEIARQLCVGLAASHIHGVLHRDLKPSNVMLDRKGNVRITDFGLAAIAGSVERAEIRAGTPKYMAPEQISGVSVTERSDIYSLGLVLYEMFSGKSAFKADGPIEYLRLHRTQEPAPPSSLAPEIDPRVEAVILACLRKDPEERPESALRVAAALPGGDLLAAALAAGQIPTREMVAVAAAEGVIDRRKILRVAAAALALFIVALPLGLGTHPITKNGGAKSPDALVEKAREIASSAGLDDAPIDFEARFMSSAEVEISTSVATASGTPVALATADAEVHFCYRESRMGPLPRSWDLLGFIMPGSEPIRLSPSAAGVTTIILDGFGRLVFFESPWAPGSPAGPAGSPANWEALVRASGHDPASLIPTESRTIPPGWHDQHQAHLSRSNALGRAPVRIETANCQDRMQYFAVLSDSSAKPTSHRASSADRWTFLKAIRNAVFLLVLVAALPNAWKNWRNRGDVVGAVRVGGFIFAIRLVALLVSIHGISPDPELIENVARSTAGALCEAMIVSLLYLALETHVRRLWPRTLGSWSRLLEGRFRGPFLGRDVLVGCLVGNFWAVLTFLDRKIPPWMGWNARPQLRLDQGLNDLLGARFALAGLLDSLRSSIYQSMLMLCVLLIATWMTARRKWLALPVAWLIGSLMYAPAATHPVTAWTLYAFGGVAIGVYVLIQYGVVSLLTAFLVTLMFGVFPITLSQGAWYAGYGYFVMAAILGLGGWGLQQALQPHRTAPDSPRP